MSIFLDAFELPGFLFEQFFCKRIIAGTCAAMRVMRRQFNGDAIRNILGAPIVTQATNNPPAAFLTTLALNNQQFLARVTEGLALEEATWGVLLVNFDAMHQSYFRDAGARYNDIMFSSRPADWCNQVTTPD